MRVSIHQPEHLPWLGFFHKMACCDLYVLLDNVQFTKNNYQNRNRLIDQNGVVYWSTVPVRMAGHTDRKICDMETDDAQPWRRKCWARIASSYRRHPFFGQLAPRVEAIFNAEHRSLVDLNIALIDLFRQELRIDVPMKRASMLDVAGTRSELLLSICKHVGAGRYLSGPSGRDYLDSGLFERHGVEIDYHQFTHPAYPAPLFKPYLSTLDLLMNHGPGSRAILGLPA